jgi:hypothetical protein
MAPNQRDLRILRDLARKYIDVCNDDSQGHRRGLWRRHNSLKRTRPLIYVRAVAWSEVREILPECRLQCQDPFYREYEDRLRYMLYWHTLEDDSIFEPWISVRAAFPFEPDRRWGPEIRRIPSSTPGGAWKYDPPLKRLDDAKQMVRRPHEIDEKRTVRDAAQLEDAIGDIIRVCVDRSPFFWVWGYDISTDLGYLRGIDQLMWDLADHPDWLHDLLSFMRDSILSQHADAESAGDLRLYNTYNQAMPYTEELPDPGADENSATRDEIWCFCASQELTLVSPAMHDEFMLEYQLPIMEKFGLSSYGCCEDLTGKIDMLRRIPNLRRIAVAPRADVRTCADRIRDDYVFSYRPNPAEMVSCGFDPDHVRQYIRRDLDLARGCHVDITLKDIETVQRDMSRIPEWVRIVREIVDSQ